MFKANKKQTLLLQLVDNWVIALKVILDHFNVKAKIIIDLQKDDVEKLKDSPDTPFIEQWRETPAFEKRLDDIKKGRRLN